MSDRLIGLAEGVPFPPKVDDFFPPSLFDTQGHWLTKFTVYTWVSVALIILFFALSYRKPRLVPTKMQYFAESLYGFVRNGVVRENLGNEGIKFTPYLVTLFVFIMVMNLWGIIPGVQISPNTHIAFPAILAIISYVMFIAVGIKKHGVGKFLHMHLIPPAPMWLWPILVPIEFFSNLILRPITLSVRLFANMFAGHLLLLVFSLGGFAMISAGAFVGGLSVFSFAMAIAMTFFEFFVAVLQAYVFVILTTSYIGGALADEH